MRLVGRDGCLCSAPFDGAEAQASRLLQVKNFSTIACRENNEARNVRNVLQVFFVWMCGDSPLR